MPKLEPEQQELNLFFSTTVPPANSAEAKKLVAEAPYHPGYEGAAISTITVPPLTTEQISSINLNSWSTQSSTFNFNNTNPSLNTWNSFFIGTEDTINIDKKLSGNALKFDDDKLPVNLLSSEALLQTAAVLKFGADKYSEHNWRQGFAWSRPLAAAMRHIMAFNDGEDKDPESGLSHLAHAMCCIMFLLEFEKTHRELDDRYKVDVPTTKDTSK